MSNTIKQYLVLILTNVGLSMFFMYIIRNYYYDNQSLVSLLVQLINIFLLTSIFVLFIKMVQASFVENATKVDKLD